MIGRLVEPAADQRVELVAVVGDAEPVPPSVKLGRTTQGRPTRFSTSRASSMVRTVSPRQHSRPIRSIAALNWSRSSALAITSALAPIISTPYFSSTPCRSRSIARFRPVCPPSVGSSASGRSRSITLATISQVSGSM